MNIIESELFKPAMNEDQSSPRNISGIKKRQTEIFRTWKRKLSQANRSFDDV